MPRTEMAAAELSYTMNICFICCEYPPGPHGGIGTMTQVLGRSLVRHGHDVRVIGVHPAEYPGPDQDEDMGVRVLRLRDSGRHSSWVASRYRLYKKIADWVRSREVELIEAPDYQGWVACWPRLAVPVIVRLHGSVTYFANELQTSVDRVGYWLERAALRRADAVCSVCEYTSHMTQQVFRMPLRSTVVYNPVELPPENSETQRERNRVVFSGTLTAKKGVVALMRAWLIVLKSCPEAELHIFGKDGRTDDGQSMKNFLCSMLNGARQTVHFHGHVGRQELFANYQRSAAAVFPSLAEAFAVAPLEAMACGCTTIYSRRGSGPELLQDGREGLLVDPDKPEQIAEAIVRVLTNVDFAKYLAAAARARVRKRFSAENVTIENIRFYEHCTGTFRSQHSRRAGS